MSNAELKATMKRHYSHPGGFVGRRIIYAVYVGGTLYGYTSANSAVKNLPGRSRFILAAKKRLNQIVNNGFFHIEPQEDGYPFRNFVSSVVEHWEESVLRDWPRKYEDPVAAFETLVELPRKGTCYLRAGWRKIGITKGWNCRRVAGESTDNWSGRRVWSRGSRKWVFMKKPERGLKS